MRLIDADALSKKLIQTTIFIKDGEVFQRMINDAPTVQAEAVHKPDYSYEADMVRRLKEALSADRPTKYTLPDGTKIPIDEESYEIGYTHGQMADRPTGEWVTLERDENVYDIYGVPTWGVNYMCDKCGFITTAIQDHFGQYKFCPNCGADMRKEESEEDHDYERAIDQLEHDIAYEPTFNPEDGSM